MPEAPRARQKVWDVLHQLVTSDNVREKTWKQKWGTHAMCNRSLVCSTGILYGNRPLHLTTATGLAQTFRLGLKGTVRDKKMGKKTVGDEIGCFLHTRATAARDKKMGKAIL